MRCEPAPRLGLSGPVRFPSRTVGQGMGLSAVVRVRTQRRAVIREKRQDRSVPAKHGKLLQCYRHQDLGRSGDLGPTFEEIDLSTGGHRDSARRGTRFEDRRDEQVRTEEILVPAMPLAPIVTPSLERVLPSRRSRRIAATSPLGKTRATRYPNAPEPPCSMTAASPC
jgi:hypothetical protein